MNWILERLSEPSSLAGIAAVIDAAARLVENPQDAQSWGVVIAGVLAIVMRERGSNGGAQ